MPTVPLPENPSLEHLKSQAKLVRDLIRTGDDGGLSMIDEFHPRLDRSSLTDVTREAFKTTDAQLIVARMYGFASWPQLRAHLGVVSERSFNPVPHDADLSASDAFIVAACLDYAEHGPRPDERIANAHRMLATDPSLATQSIAALATVGDHIALGAALEEDPEALHRPGGPNHWSPLLYATYSRIETDNRQWSATETVRLLLDRGADPNVGRLWGGLVPPFTALTGALGGGENHQPWHRDRLAIARLLLEAGADPNDGQGLYNNGIGGQNHDNPDHLELLVEYGLGVQQQGPWYEKLGSRLRDPAELLYDELEAAAKRNRPHTLAYLLGLGLDPARPIGRSQLPPARIAAAEGHDAILDVLGEHGVDIDLTPSEKALRCTRTNDVASLTALLASHPELIDDLRRDHAGLCSNVAAAHAEMLGHLVELGFDINDRSTTKTPLHHAAEAGDTEKARLLIDHGADPNLCDTHIGATPWGWANHVGHAETADMLHPVTHHGDPLPDITVTSPGVTRTLASPALIEAHLDLLHREGGPVLATLRHRRVAITVGLGHPDLSVALLLDSDGQPWHAASTDPPDSAPDLEWGRTDGPVRFYPGAYLSPVAGRRIATEYIHDPAAMPASARWEREGGDAPDR